MKPREKAVCHSNGRMSLGLEMERPSGQEEHPTEVEVAEDDEDGVVAAEVDDINAIERPWRTSIALCMEKEDLDVKAERCGSL